MATVKCYSGGKCVKTFKNLKNEQVATPNRVEKEWKYGVSAVHGIDILSVDKKYILHQWRGDFLVEY
jgi:hypothetical protein